MKNMFFLLLLGLLSCKKEPIKPNEPIPTPEPILKIVWRVPALPDTTEYASYVHTLVDGNPVFGTNFYSHRYHPSSICNRWAFEVEVCASIF